MRLLQREWPLLRREGVLLWALGALIMLCFVAALNGRSVVSGAQLRAQAHASQAVSLRDTLMIQAERGLATARAPGPVGFSVLSVPVILPLAPLEAFAIGQNDLLPRSFEVTARGAHTFLSQIEPDNSLRLSVGNFDLAFVVVWLLPLLVIALSFNLISGERERGILSLATVAGTNIKNLVLGKLIVRAGLLIAALFLSLFLAALVGGIPLNTISGVQAWLCWFGLAAVYAIFWFCLSFYINTRNLTSEHNAALLAGLWLFWVVLCPAITNLAATTMFAAPSRVALTTALREATEDADRASAGDRDRWFFDHPSAQGGEMDQNTYFKSVAQSEKLIAAAVVPKLEEFTIQAQHQQEIVSVLQYLSPGTLTYQSLTALSGSDGIRHRAFNAQVKVFHSQWVNFFYSRLWADQTLQAADYRKLPQFYFSEADLPAAFKISTWPLAVLLMLSALFFALGLSRLPRTSVF